MQLGGIKVTRVLWLRKYCTDVSIGLVFKKYWQSADYTTIVFQTLPQDALNDFLYNSIHNLTIHSYIAKTQSRYLKNCKENLMQNERLVFEDFAENYRYDIQDPVQNYYCFKSQCSLFPILLYFVKKKFLKQESFCYISKDVDHDTGFVDKIQEDITRYIRETLPDASYVKYFSKGCAAQFKNIKNIINLCHRSKDFDLNAEWVFFATSHRRSP